MLAEILGFLNVKIAGGRGERILYLCLFICGGGLFVYAAWQILVSVNEEHITIETLDARGSDDVAWPGIVQCLSHEYTASVRNMNTSDSSCSGQWAMRVWDIISAEESCQVGEYLQSAGICHKWNPKQLRYYQDFKFMNAAADGNFKSNDHNYVCFHDPNDSDPGRFSSCADFAPIGYRTLITVQMVKHVPRYGHADWRYPFTVSSTPIYAAGFPPRDMAGRLEIAIEVNFRVETTTAKTAWEVWAELGGAWGGAMLIISVCFVQKSVRGKTDSSPNVEVQVLRLRKVKSKRELLQELALMLQDAEETSTANGGPGVGSMIGQAGEAV